jgi:glycosyltransferase involved in cell wall biosynthesis
MRIAVNGKTFGRSQKGGVARVASEIVRSVAEQRGDFEFEVLVPCTGPNPPLPVLPGNVRYRLSRSRLYRSGHGRSAWEQVVLPRAVRRSGYDVLLNLSNSAPVLRPTGVPQLLLLHDAGFTNRAWFSFAYSRYVRGIVSRSLRIGTVLVTVSESAAREIRAAFPDAGSIHVVHNDADHPPPRIPELGLPYPFVLFLGFLNPRKNLRGAVAGFRRFASATPEPFRLVVVGAEESIFRADPVVSANRADDEEDRIVFAGYVSDAERWAYLREARALLFPSHAEGFGLPVLEAIRVGTPVVASDLAVIRELYADAVERVDPESPEEIARGLERACLDPEIRSKLVRRGLALESHFSWERSARRYVELIRETAKADAVSHSGTAPAPEAR